MSEVQKTVTLTEGQWTEIQHKLARLEDKIIGSSVPVARKPKGSKVTVTFIEGQPVIGYANRGTETHPRYVYNGTQDPNHHNEFMQYVDVLVRNPNDPNQPHCFSLPYVQFLQESQKVECPITNIEEKEWTINQGVTTGRTYQDGTYYMIESGVIPVEVQGKTRFFTVTLPDGSSVVLHEQYVNITK